jgi:protein-tyrosine phosphatase
MSFHRVTAQLWVGGRMGPRDWRELNDQGVTVCVNLREAEQDDFGDRLPEAALWVPVRDGSMPDVDQLMTTAAFIGAAVREGRRVVVHCRAGAGRGPLTAAAYLVSTGMSLDEALDALRQAGCDVKASAAQLAVVRDFMRIWRERQALET